VGNLITLYSDGVAIGSAIATATSTEILTNGAERLASGARSITGRQTFLGVESVNSPALMVSINATIEGRQVFYNNATGANLSSVGVAQNAIDTSKFALRPEQSSTFSNYTNYSRGLNGVIIDIGNLPTTTTNAQMLASLQFAQWNGIAANGFTALPVAAIPTVAVLGGSGTGGSARVKITFPDNTLQNTWLRVTVVSNTQTALAADDVFYFGNVVGDFDTGNTATRLRVNGQDIQQILSNQSPGNNSAVVTNIYDVNRDGRVNGQDRIVLLSNQQAGGIVAPITVPLASVPASVPGTDGDKFSLTLTAAPAVQVGSAKVAKIAKDQDAIQMNATTTSNTRPAVAASSNITEPTAVVSAAPSLIIEESRDKALSKLNRLDEFFASLGVSNAL